MAGVVSCALPPLSRGDAGPPRSVIAVIMASSNIRLFFGALFFAAGLFLCWQHGPRVKPINQDNQIYFFMAERAASGVPPHVSLVDHKNALSSILSGWAIRAGRKVGIGEDVFSARLLSMATAAATVAAVWALALELSGSLLAAHLAGLVMLTFVDFFMQGTMGVRPKTFMTFFMVRALVSFARDRRFWSGAWATCAFLCWQPALLVLGSVGAASLIDARRWRKVDRILAGAFIAMVAYEGYFLFHGALREQLFQSWAMPADIAAYRMKPLSDAFTFILRMGLWRKDYVWVFPAVFLLGLALTWLCLLIRPRKVMQYFREHPVWPGTVLCATTALAFTLVNQQAYPDMFFLQPLIAVAFGTLVGGVAEFLGPGYVPRRLVAWALTAVVAVGITQLLMERLNYFNGNVRLRLQNQYALGYEVKKLVREHGPAWAIGCPHLLAFMHMDNQSPFGLLIDPKVRAYALATAKGKPFYPLKDGKMPKVILVSRGGERKVIPWLPRYYEAATRPDFKSQGIGVWIRRSGVPIG